jgi:hypothetical protein
MRCWGAREYPTAGGLSQVLLRFNTFFTVAARPQAEADKKRVLHELAAYARPHPPARLSRAAAHNERWVGQVRHERPRRVCGRAALAAHVGHIRLFGQRPAGSSGPAHLAVAASAALPRGMARHAVQHHACRCTNALCLSTRLSCPPERPAAAAACQWAECQCH